MEIDILGCGQGGPRGAQLHPFLDVIGEVVDRRPIHFIQPAQINELIDWKSMANTRSSVSRLPLVGRVRLEQTPDEKFSPIGN